jgi:hypothetical protein
MPPMIHPVNSLQGPILPVASIRFNPWQGAIPQGAQVLHCRNTSTSASPPILRMMIVMEQDVPAHAVGVGAFRPKRAVSQLHDLPSPIEPFRLVPWPVCVIDMRYVMQHDSSASSL